jgi:hypothetical protein
LEVQPSSVTRQSDRHAKHALNELRELVSNAFGAARAPRAGLTEAELKGYLERHAAGDAREAAARCIFSLAQSINATETPTLRQLYGAVDAAQKIVDGQDFDAGAIHDAAERMWIASSVTAALYDFSQAFDMGGYESWFGSGIA